MTPSPSKPRLLVCMEQAPGDTQSGQLLVHRHLHYAADHWEITSWIQSCPPSFSFTPNRIHRAVRRLVPALDLAFGLPVSPQLTKDTLLRHRPDVVLALAHGPLFARLVPTARRLRIPVVALVHDWYPQNSSLPRALIPPLSHRIRSLCRQCHRCLVISDEMRSLLGPSPALRTLLPIPDPAGPLATAAHPEHSEPFHALFGGRFDHFLSDEMGRLAQHLHATQQTSLLRVLAPPAQYAPELEKKLQLFGMHQGFHKAAAFHLRLQQAGTLLVICPFSRGADAIARYSFPSKLPEYARHGKPIVIWSPGHSAATAWAQRTGAAACVTDPSPAALVETLHHLREDPVERSRLGTLALQQATTDFDPQRLQHIFASALLQALDASAASSPPEPHEYLVEA